MKNKRIIFIVLGVILILAVVVFFVEKWVNKDNEQKPEEITPGEEITEEQERQTIIALYYTNIETNTLVPEARVIDAKKLLENPYVTLIEYLIDAPKNEKLKSSIPEGTKVNNMANNGDTLTIDLSKEFLEGQNEESINLAIYSIVNTLTELNEINNIKILIDGGENTKIEGTNIDLSESFARKE